MKNYLLLIIFICGGVSVHAQKSVIKLDAPTLMHELRATPSPLNDSHAEVNPPRFMWPDKFPHLGPVLDGVQEKDFKPAVTYRIRIARDKKFTKELITAERKWAFFNPFKPLEAGKWYWQHAYVDKQGVEEWSPIYTFIIDKSTPLFNPPSLDVLLSHLSQEHPRILIDAKDWDRVIRKNKNNPEAQQYIAKAIKCLNHPLRHLREEIDTSQVVKLTNVVQYRSTLIRESRKIVDREEKNIESLVRAYLLTKNEEYYRQGIKRLAEILSWKESKYFAGDFNRGTILSMSTTAYDGWYNLLTPAEKKMLLDCIQENAGKFYHEYVNHLENRIADNHVWQMTFRILNMAAFATYGDLPEASTWVDYCYNEWVSRFPGLNNDGAWHNGDSYFHVNIRTLIEVPLLYNRICGFDYFKDPWYTNNVNYLIYHQPPFSKSAGHGNSHESKSAPSGVRVGYADALARQCNNPFAAEYVRRILKAEPELLAKSFLGKSGDLTWYRCTTDLTLPQSSVSFKELPTAKVFNETGVATMHTSLDNPKANAMLSFRSSPYGSTSHALANQNGFNTFFGGKEIFYSSGHRTGFTDAHCMFAYRNARAHNTILVNGMTQKIGTQGYGWIPRWYEGDKISYMVGDASNAYGKVDSPLWLKRARLSDIEYSPENGWDENKLETYRRHIVQLGTTGVYVIYDELQAKEPVTWSYLLHTRDLPMKLDAVANKSLVIKGYNKADGTSVAHLYSSNKMESEMTDQFFTEPINWKNKKDKHGRPLVYKKNYHFTATTTATPIARFLTIMDVHGQDRGDIKITRKGNVFVLDNGWVIKCNLSSKGAPRLRVVNKAERVFLKYNLNKADGKTIVHDVVNGTVITKELSDYLPDFEI